MTIYLYTGTPGSGKSLAAAGDLRFALNNGRPVIANFEINESCVRHPELFTYIGNEEMTAERIIEVCDRYWKEHPEKLRRDGRPRENYITLIIDECQLLFNSRSWQSKNRMSYVSLLSQSRKVGLKVILIAQGAKMVDNQFRMLVEYEVNHRKMSSAGMVGWLLSLPFLGRLFVRVTTFYQMNERLESQWYIAKRKDMRVYDSFKTFEQSGADLKGTIVQDPSL